MSGFGRLRTIASAGLTVLSTRPTLGNLPVVQDTGLRRRGALHGALTARCSTSAETSTGEARGARQDSGSRGMRRSQNGTPVRRYQDPARVEHMTRASST
jgi:hypothetical protein